MNMMRNEPLFFVCLSQDNLYKLLFDTEKQDFDTTLEKPASTVLEIGFVTSIVRHSESSIMICATGVALIADVDTMEPTTYIKLNSSYKQDNSLIWTPFVTEHMIPGTDCQFTLEYYDQQLIYLRTIKTGARQIFIQGSPKCARQLPCSFFLPCDDGYELHFCTAKE